MNNPFKFSFLSNINSYLPSSHEISLHPSSFSNIHPPSPLQIRDKWFVNLSSTHIPNEVQGLLQLGGTFSLPCHNKDKIITEFIKNVENNLLKIPHDLRSTIRKRSVPIVHQLSTYSFKTSPSDIAYIGALRSTKSFINNNPNIIFTRADKGNVTVALDKDLYMRQMQFLLEDENTYKKLREILPTSLSMTQDFLKRWKRLDYISESTYKLLNCTEGVLPRAYGLLKIHKPNCPLRIIVSCDNSPLYNLATFLHKIIYNSIPKADSFIANSFQLVNKLRNTHIDEGLKLVSLDVVSLFTNVPVDLALESIAKRWNYIKEQCSIPQDEFISAVRFVLDSTYFLFDNTVYRQTFGTPMDSPLSPIIADITLQDIERSAVRALPFELPFYYRYVDDIALAVPASDCESLLNTFNSFHPRLQFTIEEGADNRLNFLDVTIIVNNNRIEFDWFHKLTFSGRYLNYESRHPLSHKKGVIVGLVDRVFHLSHPKYHDKNLRNAIHILINNNYPLTFIFKILNERLKFLCNNNNDNATAINTHDSNNNNKVSKFFSIPYVPCFSDRFKRVTRDIDMTLSFSGLNNLRSIIRVHKDPLPLLSRMNVIYKIDCLNCDASYVGQTCRRLKTRISEHRNHINRNTAQRSVITDHRSLNHEFDWEGVKVLDMEPFLRKRLIAETLYITRQKNSLNMHNDTELLHQSYVSILNSLSRI